MAFRLIPRETSFNDLLDAMAARLPRVSALLLARGDAGAIATEVDAIHGEVNRVVEALVATFLTPFDREDIYRLAASLADVAAAIEDLDDRLRRSASVPGGVGVVDACCKALEAAVRALREASKQAEPLRGLVDEVATSTLAGLRSSRIAEADDDAGLALRRALLACRDAGRAVTVVLVKGI